MNGKPETKKGSADESKSLGVLYTGYLDKRNPVTGSYKKRFVVLTHESIHWFKRTEGYDLFGEERGQVVLGNILTTRILDEDSTAFEIQGTDTKKRLFRAANPQVCEEWVSAIRSAMKGAAAASLAANGGKRPSAQRRSSLAGIRNIFEDYNKDEDNEYEQTEVTALLVSVSSNKNHTEMVVARKPDWDRVITVPSLKKGDQLIISTSNGGTVLLTYEQILAKAEDGQEFEQAVQNVPLASSLKISLTRETNNFKCGGAADIAAEARRAGRKLTRFDAVLALMIAVTSERTSAINLVLSIMVIIAGLASLRFVGRDTTLLLLLAAALSLYNLNQIVQRVCDGADSSDRGQVLRVILHGHTFTSPDEPINVPENEIPQRFIDGCDGDLKEARRRWDITRHWREVEGVNAILDEPQPHFTLIKNMYPHYHCGRGKEGHVVFYERPGDFQATQLTARGIKTDQLVRHWLFTTEYQWQVMCGGDETAKGISVIDINGVGMGDLAGENMNYLKKTIAYANAHYPERSHVIFIVNAPYFFSLLWKMVKPMVHENTQKKVRILSAKDTLKGLQEHIPIESIPEYYGGQCDYGGRDSCRFFSPDSVAFNEYVKALNDRHSVHNKTPFDTAAADDRTGTDHLPPGQPGDYPMESENSGRVAGGAENTGDSDVSTVPLLKSPRRGSLQMNGHAASNSSISAYPPTAANGDDWSVASNTTNGLGTVSSTPRAVNIMNKQPPINASPRNVNSNSQQFGSSANGSGGTNGSRK